MENLSEENLSLLRHTTEEFFPVHDIKGVDGEIGREDYTGDIAQTDGIGQAERDDDSTKKVNNNNDDDDLYEDIFLPIVIPVVIALNFVIVIAATIRSILSPRTAQMNKTEIKMY
ncbi:hypothetical protein ElyMa_003677200 [Elysia marginata]|uniref:Uncharacterized protein n=1 Tax=Elysia marginata TaxID=1093978 RepID=A0AAV4F068_9GAST|nr:hypothetical protein ElyMa_003677200 [Elysia marginata]